MIKAILKVFGYEPALVYQHIIAPLTKLTAQLDAYTDQQNAMVDTLRRQMEDMAIVANEAQSASSQAAVLSANVKRLGVSV